MKDRRYECITLINTSSSWCVRSEMIEKGMKSEVRVTFIDIKNKKVYKEERRRSLFSLKNHYSKNNEENEGITFSKKNLTLSFIKKDNLFFLTLVAPELDINENESGIKLNLTFSFDKDNSSFLKIEKGTIWFSENKLDAEKKDYYAFREWRISKKREEPFYSLFFPLKRNEVFLIDSKAKTLSSISNNKSENILSFSYDKNSYELFTESIRIKGEEIFNLKVDKTSFYPKRNELFYTILIIDENEEMNYGFGVLSLTRKIKKEIKNGK